MKKFSPLFCAWIGLVSALSAPRAVAGVIFDSYKSNSAETASRYLSVELENEGKTVAIRTLCRSEAGATLECEETVRVPRARLDELAEAEEAQFQRLLQSIDRTKAKDKKVGDLAGISLGSITAAPATGPGAPFLAGASVVSLLLAIATKYLPDEAESNRKLLDHDKLVAGNLKSIKRAYDGETMALSLPHSADVISKVRENALDLTSDATYQEILAHLSRAVSEIRRKEEIRQMGNCSAEQYPVCEQPGSAGGAR